MNKMKVGILTQPLINNYGGFLQNYALQYVIKGWGYEVVTLDWAPSKPPFFIVILSALKTFLQGLVGNKRHYRYQPTKEELSIINQNFINFADQYINKTPKANNVKELQSWMIKEHCQVLIVGSDQVWRPSYCCGFETAMFFDFAEHEDVKKLAYAVSFGTDVWEFSVEQTKLIRRLIKLFSFVSVREKQGIDICKEKLGILPKHVLDPTMLLSVHDYMRLLKDSSKSNDNSLFYYILDPSEKKKSFVQLLAKSYNLRPFTVLPRYQSEVRTKENVKNSIQDCIFPSIESWIKAFVDSSVIVVDSFHGCVFSIIFNKPFWVIGNEKRGMSRFSSLLSDFNLESRLISESQIDSIDIYAPINWDEVNTILERKKESCKSLLLSQISKDEEIEYNHSRI